MTSRVFPSISFRRPLPGLVRVLLALGAILSGLRSPLSGLTADPGPFYRSQFQGNIAEHWSASQFGVTPDGKRHFMGEFAKKSNTILRLHGLPPHRLVRVRFNLLLFQGPGESPNDREPDFWSLSDSNGDAFFRGSFEFPRPSHSPQPSQSFPDEFPITHPAGTGAAERGTLGAGAPRANDPDAASNMVYHLEIAFPQSEPDLELRFCAEFKDSQPQKAWAIENVTVEAVPDFVERSDKENRKLWDDLIGRNAMDSWNALWRLAEGGPRTTAFVAQQLGAQNADERALRLVHDLTAGDSLSREKVSALIDALAPSDFLLLNAALASPETPESLRPKLRKLIEDLTVESTPFLPRVTRLLRNLGAPDAKALLARLEIPPPPPPADNLLTLAWQHSHAIDENSQGERCAFAPDGKQLFSVSSDGLRVWDVATSNCIRFVSMTNFCSLAIAPDGNTVAAGKKGGRVFIWRLPKWDMKVLEGHRGWAVGLAFTPDSKRLWTGAFDGIRCWDLDTLQQSQKVAIPTQTRHLCISPDGQMLAANQNPYQGQMGCVVMRSVETGDALRQIGRIRSGPVHAVFSPDGKLLAVAKDNDHTLIYSVETGQKINQFDSPGPQGQCAEFSPDGKYLCVAGGGGDGVSYLVQRGLHLYRMADGADVWRFTSVTSMNSVAFSSDGARMAAIDDEGRLYVWNVRRDLETP